MTQSEAMELAPLRTVEDVARVAAAEYNKVMAEVLPKAFGHWALQSETGPDLD